MRRGSPRTDAHPFRILAQRRAKRVSGTGCPRATLAVARDQRLRGASGGAASGRVRPEPPLQLPGTSDAAEPLAERRAVGSGQSHPCSCQGPAMPWSLWRSGERSVRYCFVFASFLLRNNFFSTFSQLFLSLFLVFYRLYPGLLPVFSTSFLGRFPAWLVFFIFILSFFVASFPVVFIPILFHIVVFLALFRGVTRPSIMMVEKGGRLWHFCFGFLLPTWDGGSLNTSIF